MSCMPGAQARVEGNSLVAGAHEFRVMPEGAPGGGWADHDKQPFALPAGFRPVSRADADFDAVQEKVIAAYKWSAYTVAVRKGAADGEGFSTFWSKTYTVPHAWHGGLATRTTATSKHWPTASTTSPTAAAPSSSAARRAGPGGAPCAVHAPAAALRQRLP